MFKIWPNKTVIKKARAKIASPIKEDAEETIAEARSAISYQLFFSCLWYSKMLHHFNVAFRVGLNIQFFGLPYNNLLFT